MKYAKEEMPEKNRLAILEKLAAQGKGKITDPCPLICGENCAVYPVRPIACRRFLVSGRPCKPNEDAYAERHGDLIIPDINARDEALSLLLPWHAANRKELELSQPGNRKNGLGWLKEISTFIQAVDWIKILQPP